MNTWLTRSPYAGSGQRRSENRPTAVRTQVAIRVDRQSVARFTRFLHRRLEPASCRCRRGAGLIRQIRYRLTLLFPRSMPMGRRSGCQTKWLSAGCFRMRRLRDRRRRASAGSSVTAPELPSTTSCGTSIPSSDFRLPTVMNPVHGPQPRFNAVLVIAMRRWASMVKNPCQETSFQEFTAQRLASHRSRLVPNLDFS
jgi:hypothetical protein